MIKSIPIVKTKFTPPLIKETNIHRKHVMKKLQSFEQYKMTLIHSGPGYGKSTLIANWLTNQEKKYCWYTITPLENHFSHFFIHIISAIQHTYPNFGQRLLEYVHSESAITLEREVSYLCTEFINELYKIRETFILVLDDFHAMESSKVIESFVLFFIEHLPKHVHFVLSSRIRPKWDLFTKLLVHGDMLELTETDLTFTEEEVEVLFTDSYRMEMTMKDVLEIMKRTEGWIIAIQMIWQQMKLNGNVLFHHWEDQTREELFRYLALEIFTNQPDETKYFLISTSIIDDLHINMIEDVLDIKNATTYLNELLNQNLFIYQVGINQYRYHALFKDFLEKQLRMNVPLFQLLHTKMGMYYEQKGQQERAIYHYLQMENNDKVGSLLEVHGQSMLIGGKIDYLAEVIDRLPTSIKGKYPIVYFVEGEINRYLCHYEKAFTCYDQLLENAQYIKEKRLESLGNEGKAKIFLDTIQPAKASSYLARAIMLMEGKEEDENRIIHLYSLMAENLVNLGKAKEAETWLKKCREVKSAFEKIELEARQYLRTGKLEKAKQLLEINKGNLVQENRLSQSHRETDLILSIVYSYMGDAERAKRLAETGILRGANRKSPFVEACGWIRMGHAVQIQRRYDTKLAIKCYETALTLMDEINMSRGKSEAYMGLCVLYGRIGEYELAIKAGRMALEEPNRVKDVWLSSYIHLALGIAHYYNDNFTMAEKELALSEEGFTECHCAYGKMVNHYWLSNLANVTKNKELSTMYLKRFIQEQEEFPFFLKTLTLFGPKDIQEMIPMFISAKKEVGYTLERLLNQLGFQDLSFHPGYTLKVETLGDFQIWLGQRKVLDKEWKREKAKEMFQLFVTNNNKLLSKEEIVYHLWGEQDEEAAARDFKVALNALNKVLEPERKPRETPFFILRDGTRYGINKNAGVEIDAYQFKELVEKGLDERSRAVSKNKLEEGLALYKGEYLPARRYEDWCTECKEELSIHYLHGAEKLAQIYVAEENFETAISLCEKIVKLDSCWEEAYRLLMYCHYRKNNRSYAIRIFEKCKKHLKEELGVEPMESTVRVLDLLRESVSANNVV
ncbi:BTAD domain-containing putative transcriptional regulator [Bacillus sp. FJAT-45066]|uniref:BTAD domain-containing putative transcriptional regulator n=1 Tax=Bacillus sp. FJAT-45066 TaxID=2011010 RepID=UPI000BB9B99C|nr:BTAD domain-containing putative transcriptional regulator [Bacillus sp. FJAT-45066]